MGLWSTRPTYQKCTILEFSARLTSFGSSCPGAGPQGLRKSLPGSRPVETGSFSGAVLSARLAVEMLNVKTCILWGWEYTLGVSRDPSCGTCYLVCRASKAIEFNGDQLRVFVFGMFSSAKGPSHLEPMEACHLDHLRSTICNDLGVGIGFFFSWSGDFRLSHRH